MAAVEDLAATAEGATDTPRTEWPYRFEVVPLDELQVDVAYQRPLTSFWTKVAEDFNPALVGTLIVSERTRGKKSIIDGQTRWTAMKELKLPGAPCLIYEKLSKPDEARLFADLQTKRRGMRSYDRFRAQMVAKQPMALDIARIATEQGFELGIEEKANTLKAIASFEYVWGFDPAHLQDVLYVIRSAWGTENSDATQATIVRGISHFLRYQEAVDLDRLVDRLSAVTPSLLAHKASALREGGMAGGGATIMAEAIGNEYSRRGKRS